MEINSRQNSSVPDESPDPIINFVSTTTMNVLTQNFNKHERMNLMVSISNAANPKGPTSLDSVVFLKTSALSSASRFPTFEEARDSALFTLGSDLKHSDRILYVSHRFIGHKEKHESDSLESISEGSDMPIPTWTDVTFDMVSAFIRETDMPCSHVWIDCVCKDYHRMNGNEATSQADSSILALLRASTLLIVPRVININDRSFSDLRDITSRAWVRLEISLAKCADCGTILLCQYGRDVTFLALPDSGCMDACVRLIADKFNCWQHVRRYWDRLWQPMELIEAVKDVLNGIFIKEHQTSLQKYDGNVPVWLKKQILAFRSLQIEDFEASTVPVISKLLSCLGVCQKQEHYSTMISILLRTFSFLNGLLYIPLEDINRTSYECMDISFQKVPENLVTLGAFKATSSIAGMNSNFQSFYLEWDANFFAATASWGLSVCDTWQLERELTNSLKPATIDLKNKSMGPYDIVRFSENLKKFENKWWLSDGYTSLLLLDGNSVTGSAAIELTNYFHHISFGNVSLGDGGALILGQALACRTTKLLISLDLSYCDIGSAGLESISQSCTGVGCLKMLNLDGNALTHHGIERKGIRALIHTITTGYLECLSLSSTGIDSIEAIQIASALALNPLLSYLSLSDNMMGVEGGMALARALVSNKNLRALDISFCSFGENVLLDGWDFLQNDYPEATPRSVSSHGYMEFEKNQNSSGFTSVIGQAFSSTFSKGNNITLRLLDITGSNIGPLDEDVIHCHRSFKENLMVLTEHQDQKELFQSCDFSMSDLRSSVRSSVIFSDVSYSNVSVSQYKWNTSNAEKMMNYLVGKIAAISNVQEAKEKVILELKSAMMSRSNLFFKEKISFDKLNPPGLKGAHPAVAKYLEFMGDSLASLQDFDGSKAYLLRSLSIREQFIGPRSPETFTFLLRLANPKLKIFEHVRLAEANLNRCINLSGNFFQVLGLAYHEANGKKGNTKGQVPQALEAFPSSLTKMGLLLVENDRKKEALAFFSRALNANRTLFGRNHPSVADDLTNLALLFTGVDTKGHSLTNNQGATITKAEKFLRRALEIYEDARKNGNSTAIQLASAVNNVASIVRTRRAYEEAAEMYRRSLLLLSTAVGPSSQLLIPTYIALASTLTEDVILGIHKFREEYRVSQNDIDDNLKKEKNYEKTQKMVIDERVPADQEKILGTTEVLRNVPGLVGKLHEAKEAYATAIVITQKELGRYHQSLLEMLLPLSDVLIILELYEEAIHVLWRIAAFYEESLGQRSFPYNKTLVKIGTGLCRMKLYQSAENVLEQCIPRLLNQFEDSKSKQTSADEERERKALLAEATCASEIVKANVIPAATPEEAPMLITTLKRHSSMRALLSGKLVKKKWTTK